MFNPPVFSWSGWMVLIMCTGSSIGFFDRQPKLISEMGNLVIESALDANITFRMRGRGVVKINDMNVLSYLSSNQSHSGASASSLLDIEREIEILRTNVIANRNLASRIRVLENQTNGSGIMPANRVRNLQRRLTQLETRLADLTTRIETNFCQSNPCSNGGTCQNMLGSFYCHCPDNWEGATCGQDVNECAAFAGSDLGCQNGATCLNTAGSYSCNCATGWMGIHCTRRTVDCMSAPAGELCGHGTCVQTNDAVGYKCICDQGWKTNGVTVACTVDVDECADQKPHCSMEPLVQCINLPGTYICGLCPAGFVGNGHYCSDVNECEVNNGGCSTNPSVQCINTRGSSHCGICPTGWEGNGRTCTRSVTPVVVPGRPATGPCSLPGYCHPLARCVNSWYGVATCECPSGYIGAGFGANGCRPIDLNPCTLNTCLNGGTCVANGTSFTCLCRPGFEPPLCNINLFRNSCDSHPCQNGGTCTRKLFGEFTCRCPISHTGPTCATENSVCGGVLTSPSGVLKHPISDKYPHNSRCAWLILTNRTQVLNVTFTSFNLEASSECRFDWLQIHDGRSSSAYMIGRFCGGGLPKGGNIISTHNALYLWFRSDNTTNHDGFELTWDTIDPVCGGDFVLNTHGTLSSPGSPGNYPQNRDCEWHLSAFRGKRLQLHFFTMQLETHETCDNDFLAIYDGSSTSSSELAKFCNTSHPEPITSTANEITVHFHSDDIGTDAGFQIHYSVVEGIPGCGGTYTGLRGEISSPTEDGHYPHNLRCEYLIRVPGDNHVSLKFRQFNMEHTDGCDFDYLEVYDGSSSEDPLLGRFCGNTIPDSILSKSNTLLLVLRTDWSVGYEGFRADYEIACGGTYVAENGILTSPLYPNRYQINQMCTYEIVAPPGKAVVLDFADFDIESSYGSECGFDSVQVHEGYGVNGTEPTKEYCGEERPPRFISESNLVTLVFKSDHSIQGRGFKANYSFVDTTCGGVIKTLGHTISPPTDDEDNYHRHANCSWVIVAPPNKVVQLSFSSFDLENGYTCQFDSVRVFDGFPNEDAEMGKYCGNNNPPIITSSTNVLSLQFQSDFSNEGEGFEGSYDFVNSASFCGGRRFTSSGTIRSPGWPEQYPPGMDCFWVIIAPAGKQIELTVNKFELESMFRCYDFIDHLEIRNGEHENSPLIGRYCSKEIPRTIRSFTNKLSLRFKSDSSISARGFEINWQSTMTGCGGNIRDTAEGSITSPNYPENYDMGSSCEWRISVSQGSIIQIDFTDMDLEAQGSCVFDSVSIYDGRNIGAKQLGRYCGTRVPVQINSTSNELLIRMVSDSSNQGRGFELRYKTICERRLTAQSGVIQSPNNPHNYRNNEDCEWTITAPKGNKIQLTFTQFELEDYVDSSNNCQFDFVEITQMDSTRAVLEEKKYCHQPAPLTSFKEVVKIRFHTDSSVTSPGFRLEYNFVGCGGRFIRPEGQIVSPNYPSSYPTDTHCRYDIEIPFGNLIELTIYDYDFQQSPNCTADGLLVSDIENDTDVKTRYCGRMEIAKPIVITSHSNKLHLLFYSDGDVFGRGFNASYRTVPISCGGIFKNTKGSIMSPKYPQNYDPNLHCEWLIQTTDSHTLLLNFEDFSLERFMPHVACEHDYVLIFDGAEQLPRNELARLCGNNITANMTFASTGSQMLVVLITDFSNELKGFKANYKTSCGANIEIEDAGLISGHNFEHWSTPTCTWTLTTKNPDQHIQLIFTDMYFMDNCGSSVTINVGDTNSTRLCNFEGHRPPVYSIGNSMSISLTPAPQATTHTFRFEAMYAIIENGCGNTFNSKRGSIASPHYPRTYPLNVECEWTIQASPGNQIQLSVNMLDIDESEHCNDDYLELREEKDHGKLIGVYCGNDAPSNLPSFASGVWMKFFSGNAGVGQGFLIDYSYVKLVDISGTEGVITSPIYPKFDFNDENQQYRISVKIGQLIALVIEELVGRSDSKLTIYDGYDEQSAILGTYNFIPVDPIYSTSNDLLVRWDVKVEGIFKLKWNEVSSANSSNSSNTTLNCTANSIIHMNEIGNVINITSPGYPFGYDTNLACQWTFIPAMGYHPVLSFETVDLENIQDCKSDFVAVSNGSSLVDFQNIETLCTPTTRVSTRYHYDGTPYLRLNFVSDYYTNRTGFNALVRLACGGILTTSSGFITKGMTVSDMTGNPCLWTISVREGRTIQIKFNKLSLTANSDGTCNSYILLRNGHSSGSPFLGIGKFCGTSEQPTLQTIGNNAYIEYYPGTGTPTDDFSISYQEVSVECGTNVILSDSANASTVIQSPNYPNIPNPFSECLWTVTAPHGELIRIDFIDNFEISPGNPCQQEFVELRDGGTPNSQLIGTYCDQKPSSLITASNVVRIRYLTQIKVPRNGFRARISVYNCGGFYRGDSGMISSPNFPMPGGYPSNSVCDYRIFTKVGSTVRLTFNTINLPNLYWMSVDGNCSSIDHIELYNILPSQSDDGTNSTGEMSWLGTFCGDSIPEPITTDGFEILVRLVTFASTRNHYTGFQMSFNSTKEKCGGEITASAGFITSPGYPVGRSVRQFCEWRITVPKGRRVRVDIMDFDILVSNAPAMGRQGQSNTTRALSFSQRLSFYNDMAYASRIKVLTGEADQSLPVYSSDNVMMINMWMRSNGGHRGFKLNFTSAEETICFGDFNSNEGTIRMPTNESFSCNYQRDNSAPFFTGPSGAGFGTLALRIIVIENINPVVFESVIRCAQGSILPIKVTNTESFNVRRKCLNGTENIFDYATPFANTQLQARVHTFIQSFHVDYKLHPCGQVIESSTSYTIVPVAMETNYGEVHCVWHFSAKPGMKVKVNVEYSKIDCEKEFLNIFNGGSINSPKVDRVCGNEAASRNFSSEISGEKVLIEFHSERYNPDTRYTITIDATYDLCGGLLVPPFYTFNSPMNGTKYPNNLECIWEIRARPGFHVGLAFVDRFFVEESTSCVNDYVSIYDKNATDYTPIAQVCGRSVAKSYNSSSEQMRVMFRTNNLITADGFTAVWSENCGGLFTATLESKTLVSPRYPENYPRNTMCNYTIEATVDTYVNIRFDDFVLEDAQRGCVYDNLTVYKAADYSNDMELVGSYCRKDSLKFLRFKRKVTMIFMTDQWLEKRGFRLHYSLDDCGGDIRTTTQVRVPIKPDTNSYMDDLRCVWNITAPDDQKIAIRFETLDLEGNDMCYQDYVEVFEGHSMDSTNRKAQLCGNLTHHTPVVSINGNKAMMRFNSDLSVAGGGFSALIIFMAKCDQEIELTELAPTFHLSESSTEYRELLDCHYKVWGPDGWVVKMEFTEFHVAPCQAVNGHISNASCTCDFVEIRDGGGPFAEKIVDSLCGHVLPNTVISTHSSMWARFATDSTIGSTGFKATFTLIRSACGPRRIELNETTTEHTLSWPMQSGKYLPNQRCHWEWSAPYGSQLIISFDRLDTQPNGANETAGCSHDYLEIVDWSIHPYIVEGLGQDTIFTGDKNAQVKPSFYQNKHFPSAPHQYCGSGHPTDFITSDNKALVKFISDSSDERSGFSISAKLLKACHRNYTSLSGRIVSNNLDTCETYISVPVNHTIALYFSRFNIYPSAYPFTCTESNSPLKIYDGDRLATSTCMQVSPSPFFSNTSRVTLKFIKQEILQWGSGAIYDIMYVATDQGQGCGGEIFNYGGQFTSPMYPSVDRGFADCRWVIDVPQNLVVSINFDVWDLGSKKTCAGNFVQLLQPTEEGEELKRTFCGDDLPAPFVATSNRLIVRFKKSVNFAGTGWVLNFMAVHPNAAPSLY